MKYKITTYISDVFNTEKLLKYLEEEAGDEWVLVTILQHGGFFNPDWYECVWREKLKNERLVPAGLPAGLGPR